MSTLIPTSITDKNGKKTTVHKRSVAPSSRAKSIPAPSVQSSTAPRLSAPLVSPPALSKSESAAYIDRIQVGSGTAKMLQSLPSETISLMKHLEDEGKLTDKEMLSTINGCLCAGDDATFNGLWVIAGVKEEHPEWFSKSSVGIFCQHVNGLGCNLPSRETERVTTEHDLSAMISLVYLSTSLINEPKTRSLVREQEVNGVRGALTLSNRHLDALVREQPDKAETILSYIKERGMHRTNKREVVVLREYLDDIAVSPAVGDGWL